MYEDLRKVVLQADEDDLRPIFFSFLGGGEVPKPDKRRNLKTHPKGLSLTATTCESLSPTPTLQILPPPSSSNPLIPTPSPSLQSVQDPFPLAIYIHTYIHTIISFSDSDRNLI